MREIKSVIEL